MRRRHRWPWPPRLPGVKPGEEGPAVFLFAFFFLLTAPFSVFKSIRDAAFLTELGSENLPVAYATALVVGLVVALQAKYESRLPRRVLLAGSLIFFSLTGALFALAFRVSGRWLALAYWVWANVLIVSLMTQFWILVNDWFNPREAKRLIGFIGSGGILGGIVGGVLTGLLARRFPLGVMLLGCLLLLAAVPLLVRFLDKGPSARDEKRGLCPPEDSGKVGGAAPSGFRACFQTVVRDRYLRLLAGTVVMTGLISTFIDWQSKAVIERTVRRDLASFFGWFNAGLLVFSFLLQLLGTSRIVNRFGLRSLLLFFPVVILLCTIGLSIWPVLGAAMVLKGSDKSLSYSINQSARELLYFPLPPAEKARAKIFIDMFLNRLSRTVGAVFLLAVLAWPGLPSLQAVGVLSLIALAIWIALNVRAASAYVRLVKDRLRGGFERGDRRVEEELDVDFAKTVFDLLETRRRSPVLFGLHLYDLIRSKKLTPEIRSLLLSESGDPRFAALGGLFEGGAEGAWAISGGEEEEAALVQNVDEIFGLKVYDQVMEGYLAGALETGGREDAVTRMEIAKVLGYLPRNSPLVRRLEGLLEDESEDVVRYAMESAGRLARREFVPALVGRLDHPRLEGEAEEALVKFGSGITGTLLDLLGDASESLETRKASARILGRIGVQEAVDGLLHILGSVPEELEQDVIDALDRVRSGKASVRFDRELVGARVKETLRRLYRDLLSSGTATAARRRAAVKHDPLRSGKAADRILGLFKLLGLVFSREDLFKAFANWRSGSKESVAYALELLENSLPKTVRQGLVPLLEDLPRRERERVLRARLKHEEDFRL